MSASYWSITPKQKKKEKKVQGSIEKSKFIEYSINHENLSINQSKVSKFMRGLKHS